MAKVLPFRWRRLIRLAGILLVSLLTLFGITTWLLFQQRNQLLVDQLQHYLGQSQSGQLTVKAVELRLFRDLPDLSVQLDSVAYFERIDSLREPGEMPLFSAKAIDVSLSLWQLLEGNIEISEVTILHGQLTVVEYAPGDLNINRALKKPGKHQPVARPRVTDQKAPARKKSAPKTIEKKPVPSATNEMRIKLENVELRDIRVTWQPSGWAERSSLLIESVEAELNENGGRTAFSVSSRYRIDKAYLRDIALPESVLELSARGQFDRASKHLEVRQANLSVNDFRALLSGTYDHRNQGRLDVQVNASAGDLPLIEKLLRQEALRHNRDLLRAKDLYLKGRVYGDLLRHPPLFDLAFGAASLSLRLPDQYGSFKDIGFEGTLTSGPLPDYSGARLELKNLKGRLPGGHIRGDVVATNFQHPWLTYRLDAQLRMDGYDKVFRISRIENLSGTVTTKMAFDGPLRIPWPGSSGPKGTFDASFQVKGLAFNLPGKPEGLRDGMLTGTFQSGPNPDHSMASLEITELMASLPGGKLKGKFQLVNLSAPQLHYNLSAAFNLKGLDELLQLGAIRDLAGKAYVQLQFDGPLDQIGTHAMDSSRASVLRLDSVSFVVNRNNRRITNLNASLVNQNNLADANLSVRYGSSDLKISAKAENLMHRIFKSERLVQVTGKIESQQLDTRDFILDSLRKPLVDDHVSDLSLGFEATNELPKESATTGELGFHFQVRNLSARFTKLPDIRDLDAKGTFRKNSAGLSFTLEQFALTLPTGKLSVNGELDLPARRQLNARVRVVTQDFPWAYVNELVDEIKEGAEPTRKLLPAKEMSKLTATLDFAARVRTFPFDVEVVEFRNSNGWLTLPDGKRFGMANFQANFEPLYFLHPPNSGAITGLRNVSGTAQLEGIKVPGLIDLSVDFDVQGSQDSLQLPFISRSRQAVKEEGLITLDFSPPEPTVRFYYSVNKTPADALVRRISQRDFLKGDLSYSFDFHTSGRKWEDLRRNLVGTLSVDSDSLDFYGIDIDEALTRYEKSQKFNLADLGAVVLVGPLGIVATKGSNFVSLATLNVNSSQRSHIRQFLAEWKLEDRVLSTTDVAFRTQKNRIAFTGAIDFARDSIAGMQIAVVDKKGCSLMDQQVYGKFSSIQTGKLNITKTLFGSVTNFVDAIAGKDCQPVYTGKVKP